MEKIWIVEDDDNIREIVAYALKSSGFDVKDFSDGKIFANELKKQLPDLVLLDIMLPETDGLTLLTNIREDIRTKTIPVIMVTAKGTEYDKIKGLDLGADDYISKPFSIMEVVARVKALLRRSQTSREKSDEITLGNLVFSESKHKVIANGKEANLTYKEFELLNLLLKNQGIVLDRDKILTMIWGYDYDGENRTVDMHIKTLRQKLGDCGKYIKTIRNVGYKIEE
ncbi:MAG: response regulator transcription factor [Lachnospiraceae bacterium]|nr:response regulator transcription factor [Lachnospiraceae bacterium]